MEEFSFINKETNKEIKVQLDKQTIIIFGRNGSGKTTLSRCFDERFVFNTDFIYRNVYVENIDGAKENSGTKESFSSLWVDERIVELKKRIIELQSAKKSIDTAKQKLKDEIVSYYSNYGIPIPNESILIGLINTDDYTKPIDQTDENIIKSYKATSHISSTITDDNELIESIKRYKNNILNENLINEIKKNSFVSELIFNDFHGEKERLASLINEYNLVIDSIKRQNEAFVCKDISREQKWLKDGISLHEGLDDCLFCKNKNIGKQKEEWIRILNDESIKKRDAILHFIENALGICDKIISESKYDEIASKTLESLKTIIYFLKRIKDKIDKTDIVGQDIVLPTIESDEILKNYSDLLNNIQFYIFKPFIDKYEIIHKLIKYYESKIISNEDTLIKELNNNSSIITESINKKLLRLGLDKELSIQIDKRGNERKYSFKFTNLKTNISTLSDGQKHKLALAIFLASIEKYDLNDKIVVLDDPVVTMDYRTYYAVKNEIIEISSRCPKHLIILTHNISYLYVQLSNVFDNETIKNEIRLLHLHSHGVEELSIDILNYDDLMLYKKCIEQLEVYSEFKLLSTMNLRIYRYFLDLYSRMSGICFVGTPAETISKVANMEKVEGLKEINSKIEIICKKKNPNAEEMYNGFKLVNDFIDLLGFPKLLTDEEMKKIKRVSETGDMEKTIDVDKFIYLILDRSSKLQDSTNEVYKGIKENIRHPRVQLTSTIVGYDFTDTDHF